MKHERTKLIEYIRSEIVGPACQIVDFEGKDIVSPDMSGHFDYPSTLKAKGIPLFWSYNNKSQLQEIIHYGNETPLNRYGSGMLFPFGIKCENLASKNAPNEAEPTEIDNGTIEGINAITEEQELLKHSAIDGESSLSEGHDFDDDFDITNPDMYHPSTLGISFCVEDASGSLVLSLPNEKRFFWQEESDSPIQLNGTYKKGKKTISQDGKANTYAAWLRMPATTDDSRVLIPINELQSGKKLTFKIPLPTSTLFELNFELFPRKYSDSWLVTVVLRNVTHTQQLGDLSNEAKITSTLFQTYFEVETQGVNFTRYPEGVRPFEQLDEDEQTLALLYQDSATWAIGHGCSGGWDSRLGEVPQTVYADVFPAVELPSMTPDIKDENGNPVNLSMHDLAEIPSYSESSNAWQALNNLCVLYRKWIHTQQDLVTKLDLRLQNIAQKHLDSCEESYARIVKGIDILKNDEKARLAFQLANKSMLLQQIAGKQLQKRQLVWNSSWVEPDKPSIESQRSPSDIYPSGIKEGIGNWRAFQIAFLLMSLDGLVNENSSVDREIVDLIWFPTGGGKTEAYLGVAAFYLFHQRLIMSESDIIGRDGTSVFMRYTLRMLTTQQFQRAASLICAMEYIRREINSTGTSNLGRKAFSLGLWIGGDGSPNKCDQAKTRISQFKKGKISGNPLVLTECPWCRSEIGRIVEDPRKGNKANVRWDEISSAGFGTVDGQPVLKCSDDSCCFGGEYGFLPIEVIDERIYENPPSMFISTADKFAMLSYKPEAGALFGRARCKDGVVRQVKMPPGLIIQDEFHLISGPLGTMYGVYEGIIENLCSVNGDSGKTIKPKIIASTATIRGAKEQVKAVYSRNKLQLFPSPGLLMKDSFFGRYETKGKDNELASGRLYLGLHAEGYGSFLTTQVRAFTALLFRSSLFDNSKKDAWWTLLAFYNSLREIGGARTLFDSDISSRLKNYMFRYGQKERYLNQVVELTSRRSQAELVELMDRLSVPWSPKNTKIIDACLASNIIEVGVDIDRLSLMAVVGQPKSTAQYIQVTGRVGRQWWDRPGLILSMYNPSKSRDKSHYEQFHTYHRRLYERVEPTSATPFSVEAISRSLSGVMLLWARQFYSASTPSGQLANYKEHLSAAKQIIVHRCDQIVEDKSERERVIISIEDTYKKLLDKWEKNPQKWQEYPQKNDGEYLMLWPGQHATKTQKLKGEVIPSSMRSVDSSAYLQITDQYIQDEGE